MRRFLCLLVVLAPLQAQRVMENLGRGLIALHSPANDVYVGWRLLATDPPDVAFNLYRSTDGKPAVKLNREPLLFTTDFVDSTANLARENSYFVRPVVAGREQASSASFTLPAGSPLRQYLEIPLQRPPGGTAECAGSTSDYTYSANDGSVGDLDGDGQLEIILKWDPSNAQDNANNGCTGPAILDGYKLDGKLLWRINLGPNIRSGAHYTQFMVYDLDGDGKAEIVAKTADGTVDGVGGVIEDGSARWADATGRVLNGPEYLTVFDGATGATLANTFYIPGRGKVTDWGDNYGNRSDRFLAAVAYLDGVHPSVVMARGYYAKTTLAAWDWRGGVLSLRWFFDSKTPGNSIYEGQGNHSISVADVDGDGRDEIIYGAAVIDDDGKGLFSTGLGHGDAMHVSRFDPDNPDVLVYGVHENSSINTTACAATPRYGTALYNAGTGALVMTTDTCVVRDFGRGVAAALDPDHPGANFWGGGPGLVNLKGESVGKAPGSSNFVVWWDDDLLRELEDGKAISKYDIHAGTGTTTALLTCAECASNNGTKSTPVLTGDLFGDWREEVIWRTADNLSLRIYSSTIPAKNRMYTLLQDSQYRLALVWQNVAYNQPPWPSFYIGPGMSPPPVPAIEYPVELSAGLLRKSGAMDARVWTVAIRNSGTAPARAAVIQNFELTQTAGYACSPSLVSPARFPYAMGDIGSGIDASAGIMIDFSRCGNDALFRLAVPYSAMNGAASGVLLRENLAP